MQKLEVLNIYAELTGYGATSDGYDMVAPSGEGAVRCMKMAMATAKNKMDYYKYSWNINSSWRHYRT